ncbi:MAG: ESPR domain-containing protein [Negativicoccus succinicivorans]|uniref:ESPR domain-containing protein n=1 Tax=Negativicoccus succinicivorans TaxID=620903 RepID=UPI0029081F47|nr:ESPR domain-containing protein [Negativicoccus succinicivorans]MDU5371917.1 ESPR domain-containing protein [Negativicoccus succinicivorans]MDU5399670.1 ESPR domain-containing protein [Negativicoccus succinicivorans]
MNRVYKVIWNKGKNSYSVVSEIAKNHGKVSSCRNKAVMAAMVLSLLSAGGLAYAQDPATPAPEPKAVVPYFSVNANDSTNPAGTM